MRSVINEVRAGVQKAIENCTGPNFCTAYQRWMGGACGPEQKLEVKRRAVILGKLIDSTTPIVSFSYVPGLAANAQAWGYADCLMQDTTQLRRDTAVHNTIEIGPTFFNRGRWETASRAETVLHELSHRVFGARDHVDAVNCTGQVGNVCDYPTGARNLATNVPAAAACNAENWGQLFNALGGTNTL